MEIIHQLFKAIREASKDIKPEGQTTGSSSDSGCPWEGSDQSKSLFEVKYIGRAKVGAKRVTAEYIDCLAEKMIAREEDLLMKRIEEREERRKQEEKIKEEDSATVPDQPDNAPNLEHGFQSDHPKPELDLAHLTDRSCQGSSSSLENTTSGSSSLHHTQEYNSVDITSPGEITNPGNITPGYAGSGHFFIPSSPSTSSVESNFSFTEPPRTTEPPRNTEPPKTTEPPSPSTTFHSDPLGVLSAAQPPSPNNADTLVNKSDPSRRRHSSHREEGNVYSESVINRFRHASGDSQDSLVSLHEPSRVMVLQISHQDISLISLDKKVAILECKFKDISSVSQGHQKPDMFGVVVREGNTFICYILRCLNGPMVTEIMGTLQTAFTAAYSKGGSAATTATTQQQMCTMCPLHQLHRLSQEMSSLSTQAAHDLLVKKVHQLPEKDVTDFNHYMQAESPESFEENNEVIMIYLRKLCERKQKEHTHISDGNRTNKIEINLLEEKTKLFEGFRSKARKSLTTSFENLLSRGKKKEEIKDGMRQRSWTTDSEASWQSMVSLVSPYLCVCICKIFTF
ncbi:TBC1 domain family member 1-like [Physella acuta]|uniref:TBC1 domain family member 1-like n=1 Tax=Physella acuta TaxID=109671 RepID=UPI0027DDDBCC|nr:TBC1 domain family member 1-like [Physella acuta]